MGLFGFQIGSLPARYLGVPLISSKLSSKDCKMLVDKITARLKSWTTKHLSYAGRIQLIISVLSSLQVYWMGLFLLPKQVTYQLDQLLRSFLWSGSDLKLKGAKVSWDMITRLKSEGGLGIKKLTYGIKHVSPNWFGESANRRDRLFGWIGFRITSSETTPFGKFPFHIIAHGLGGQSCSSGRRFVHLSVTQLAMAYPHHYGLICGFLLAQLCPPLGKGLSTTLDCPNRPVWVILYKMGIGAGRSQILQTFSPWNKWFLKIGFLTLPLVTQSDGFHQIPGSSL